MGNQIQLSGPLLHGPCQLLFLKFSFSSKLSMLVELAFS